MCTWLQGFSHSPSPGSRLRVPSKPLSRVQWVCALRNRSAKTAPLAPSRAQYIGQLGGEKKTAGPEEPADQVLAAGPKFPPRARCGRSAYRFGAGRRSIDRTLCPHDVKIAVGRRHSDFDELG